MKFATSDLGTMLRAELNSALAASVAVAFFNPDNDILSALGKVPNLRLVISDDFQVNDPYKLESLASNASLRAVPADANEGKLHAKVFLIRRQDNTRWAMVGSANLTRQGLFSNQEAGMIFDSSEPTDSSHLDDIEEWFKHINEASEAIDFDIAKRVFDMRASYRLVRPQSAVALRQTTADSKHWALKATEGAAGRSHWDDFKAEDVIAIGWPAIRIDPSVVSNSALVSELHRAYPDEDATGGAKKIKWFVEMGIGDFVLVCRGYTPRQLKDVHIHGFARVEGPFRYEAQSPWWLFKRDATIQVIDQTLTVDVVAGALNKGSLMQAIHKLEREEFEELVRAVWTNLGIKINI